MDKSIFTLIARTDEKIKIWKTMSVYSGEILCKGKLDNLCRVRITNYNDQTHTLEGHFDSADHLEEDENYLGHFTFSGEKYYFQGTAQIQGKTISIKLPEELYYLQRRQNFRVNIPSSYKATSSIKPVGEGEQKSFECLLADISSRGCRLQNTDVHWRPSVGDEINCELHIKQSSFKNLKGIIRHAKIDENRKSIQTLGVEFISLSPLEENKLFALIMEIHKTIFKPS